MRQMSGFGEVGEEADADGDDVQLGHRETGFRIWDSESGIRNLGSEVADWRREESAEKRPLRRPPSSSGGHAARSSGVSKCSWQRTQAMPELMANRIPAARNSVANRRRQSSGLLIGRTD